MSLAQLAALSGVKSQDVSDVLVDLRELLDLTTGEESSRSRIFHTSFRDFLTNIDVNPDYWINPQNYHQQIASYYIKTYGGDWAKCDRYGLQYVPSHLSGAGCFDQLRGLLFNFDWVQAKLTALDVNSVFADFSFLLGDGELGLALGAIKLGAHNIATDKTQLAGQLLGRLMSYDSPGIQMLLRKASQWRAAPWLRPLTPGLALPGGPLLNTIKAHSAVVEKLALTLDGEKILSASGDETVKVWSLRTGLQLQTLRGHTEGVSGVAVCPDGKRAISSSLDRTLKVWDVEEGEELFTLKAHEGWVTCVALTRDGRTAVSGSSDKTLRIWDVETGRLLRTLEGHSDHLQDVALLNDQRRILSASWDRTLRCWDMETGEEVAVLDQTNNESFTAVAVSQDERVAVWASGVGQINSTVTAWNIIENRKLFTFKGHTSMIKSVAISPDGLRAASGSWDQTIRIWDLVGGTHLRTLYDNDDLAAIKFLDVRHVISGSYDGNIKIWDIDSESGAQALGDPATQIRAAAIDMRGHAVVGRNDSKIEIWDSKRGSKLKTLEGHRGSVNAVSITPDGQHIVSASNDRTLKVWDIETGAVVRTLEGHASVVWACSLSEDGRLVVSHSEDKVFKVWDFHSGSELRTLADKNHPYPSILRRTVDPETVYIKSLAVTPDGKRLISASSARDSSDTKRIYLSIWDWEANAVRRILTDHYDYINAVAITPDGRLGISASDDYTLEVWDLEQLTKLYTLKGHTDWIKHVIVTPDGKRAISATGNGPFSSSPEANLRVWDLTQGVEIFSLHGGKNLITSLAVTQDGRRVFSTSGEGGIKAWDIEAGKEVAMFNSEYALNTCAVSADGLTIVAGGKTEKIHLLVLEGQERQA